MKVRVEEKKGEKQQTADLKHFQLLQDQIFMQGIVAWQHNYLLNCPFVCGAESRRACSHSHTHNAHKFNNSVKKSRLYPHVRPKHKCFVRNNKAEGRLFRPCLLLSQRR